MSDETRCARCGEVAAGYAKINSVRYCHPDDPDAPDCYTLTLWGALPAGWVEGKSYTFNVSGDDLYPLREHIARCLEIIKESPPSLPGGRKAPNRATGPGPALDVHGTPDHRH